MPTLLATLYFTCWLALSIGRESCFTNSLSSNASKKRSLLPQDKIMKTLTYYKLDKALSQDLIDSAETALRSWSSEPSVFLSQPEQKAVSEAFRDLIGLDVDFAGGFNGAENCRAIFQRAPDVQEEYYGSEELASATEKDFNIDEFVAVVNIEGNFLFEKATYSDFKSALTNTLGSDKGQVNSYDSFDFYHLSGMRCRQSVTEKRHNQHHRLFFYPLSLIIVSWKISLPVSLITISWKISSLDRRYYSHWG